MTKPMINTATASDEEAVIAVVVMAFSADRRHGGLGVIRGSTSGTFRASSVHSGQRVRPQER